MKKRILIAFALSVVVAIGVPSPASAEKHEGTQPDNTKMNKEMRDEKAPTADQQSEKDTDRKMTQSIRRAIVKDKSLSTYAHNVKIITVEGKVTLKGPVRSKSEKQAVEKAAEQVAGKGNVTNELQIKPAKAKAKAKEKEEKKEEKQ